VAQVGWSFPWACQWRMIIPMSMPREDDRYLELAGLLSPNALDLTCLLDPHYLSLGE